MTDEEYRAAVEERTATIMQNIATAWSTPMHLNGVPYYDMPLPKRLHRCSPQSRILVGVKVREWCACGATRLGSGHWRSRNIRRKRASR